jgi:hypothetical protein
LATEAVVGKWHTTFDIALALCSVIVFLFALLVLYVVTHMNASHLSELKATIGAQRKELRKLRRKTMERAQLIKDRNGDLKAGNGYGTLGDKKKQEILGKIRPYISPTGEVRFAS